MERKGGETEQQVTTLPAKPGDWSSIPGIHMAEGEEQFKLVIL